MISASACGYQNLFVWPNGRIEGVVRSADGKLLNGILVQGFIQNTNGELDSSPVREEKSNQNGRYVLSGIPPGEVVVGVNGEKYNDKHPWPPIFYAGTSEREKAQRLNIGRGGRLTGIDLTIGAPRPPATLRIEAVLEDGSPATDAGASVENLQQVQRAFALGRESHTHILSVPVYVGESYLVKSFRFTTGRSWAGEAGPITVTGTEVRVRVVWHEVKLSIG